MLPFAYALIRVSSMVCRYTFIIFVTLLFTAMPTTGIPSRELVDELSTQRQLNGTGTPGGENKVYTAEPGKPLELNIKDNVTHFFPISLASNQFLDVVVEQRGVDLAVSLLDANGGTIFQIDSTSSSRGEETLFVVAETSGSYTIKVQPVRAATGGEYTLVVRLVRDALPEDKLRGAATKAMAEGDRLRKLRDGASLPKAIDSYTLASKLWRQVGDDKEIAKALYNCGKVYALLDDNPRALDCYMQSLPFIQAPSG